MKANRNTGTLNFKKKSQDEGSRWFSQKNFKRKDGVLILSFDCENDQPLPKDQ